MRLLRLTTIVTVVLFLTILIARLVGSTRPLPLTSLFTDSRGAPCNLPCLFGIQPKQTKFGEALTLLKTHPLLGAPKTYKEQFDYTGTQMITFTASWNGTGVLQGDELWLEVYNDLEDNDGTVVQIEFYMTDPRGKDQPTLCRVPVGDMINVLGIPELQTDNNGILDRLFYFHDHAISASVVPVEGQDYKLGIYRPRPSDCLAQLKVQAPYAETDLLKWCGFTVRQCQ